MNDLFEHVLVQEQESNRPLADIIRPKSLNEVIGQEKILCPDGLILNSIRQRKQASFILFGPPGTGKTTIAKLIAKDVGLHFEELTAISSGVADLRRVFQAAKIRRVSGLGTLLFIDEIHHFSKSQQDSFLPYIEDGTINLIGATTENPNFELNAALISRVMVLNVISLTVAQLERILIRAEMAMDNKLPTSKEGRDLILEIAQGDARALINLAEVIFSAQRYVDVDEILDLNLYRTLNYSKTGEQHYNFISAFQKSIRGSDPDASLYWLARMMNAGEDPRYILRRMLRTSYEDIGLADLGAQDICLTALNSFERLGSPEGDIVLAHAVIYLALAPKSNSAYQAYNRATQSAAKSTNLPPPKHLVTQAQNSGNSRTAKYLSDHDTTEGFSGQQYFPEDIGPQIYYRPIDRGQESELKKRLDYFTNLRKVKSIKI